MRNDSNNSKKTYHHGDLRKVLLDNAAQLLREDGEAGLSMRKLAAITGVSHTAPYHHFADKQTLLCAIAEEGFRMFRSALHPENVERGHTISEQRLHDFVNNYVEFATTKSEYYDLMFGGHLWKSRGLSKTLTEEAHGAFRGYLERTRQWRQQDGASDTFDALRYSQVTWSTLHGMSRLLIDGIYVDDQAKNEMCKATADMFWRELTLKQ